MCEQSRDEATVEGAFGGGGVCRHRQENAACIGLRRWCASSELVNVIQHVTIVGRLRNHVRLGGVAAIAHGSIHFFDRPPAPADVVCIQQGGHSLRPGIGVLNRFSIPYRNVVLSPDIEISLDRRQIIGVPVFVKDQDHVVVPGGQNGLYARRGAAPVGAAREDDGLIQHVVASYRGLIGITLRDGLPQTG